MKLKLRKPIKKCLLWLLILGVLAAAIPLGINLWVVKSTASRILTPEKAAALCDVDCILVLGCGVYADGTPTAMLADRLQQGIALYDAGASGKLLMSGDHGQTDYDEVNAMRNYALAHNIPSSDVFMDHAGFSTYETVYRAKEIFEADKVLS